MLQVQGVPEFDRIVLTVDGDPKQYVITDVERTEVLPEVYVSCGKAYRDEVDRRYSRLAFEAPRRIRIERQQ